MPNRSRSAPIDHWGCPFPCRVYRASPYHGQTLVFLGYGPPRAEDASRENGVRFRHPGPVAVPSSVPEFGAESCRVGTGDAGPPRDWMVRSPSAGISRLTQPIVLRRLPSPLLSPSALRPSASCRERDAGWMHTRGDNPLRTAFLVPRPRSGRRRAALVHSAVEVVAIRASRSPRARALGNRPAAAGATARFTRERPPDRARHFTDRARLSGDARESIVPGDSSRRSAPSAVRRPNRFVSVRTAYEAAVAVAPPTSAPCALRAPAGGDQPATIPGDFVSLYYFAGVRHRRAPVTGFDSLLPVAFLSRRLGSGRSCAACRRGGVLKVTSTATAYACDGVTVVRGELLA